MVTEHWTQLYEDGWMHMLAGLGAWEQGGQWRVRVGGGRRGRKRRRERGGRKGESQEGRKEEERERKGAKIEGKGEKKEKFSPTCMVEFRKQLCHCLRSANPRDTFTEETGPDVILCHISMFSDDILRAGIVNTRNKLWLKSHW